MSSVDEPAGDALRSSPSVERASRSLAIRFRPHRWANLLYLAPMGALLGLFVYYAIAYTLNLSFYQWNGVSLHAVYVGLANFQKLAKDPIFWRAATNTVVLAVLVLLVQNGIGLSLAVLLRARVRFSALYHSLFFLPVVISPAVLAFVFRRLFDPNAELSQLLNSIGLGFLVHSWLGDPNTVLLAICGIIIWEYVGFSFVMYSAGLTQIDKSVYEAATLDGASFYRVVRSIAFPLLKRTHITLMILSIVGAIKIFDIVYLTTEGGPARASEFVSTYLYKKAIPEFAVGYASALGVVLISAALLVTVVQLWLFRRDNA